jgi:hypothetical protein
MGRLTIGRPLRTRGRGTVRVERDDKGQHWVTCSGCRSEEYVRALNPARVAAQRHADACTR